MAWRLRLIKAAIRKIFKERSDSLTVEQARKEIRMIQKLFPSSGGGITDAKIGEMDAEWVRSRRARSDYTVLYLHGGAYFCCSPATHRGLTRRISRFARAQVLAIDYRLAPEHPFPAAVDDAEQAYRWLLDQDVAPERLAVVGDSAGGGLTMALMIRLKDCKLPLPASVALMSPWLDLTMSGESVKTNAESDPMVPPKQMPRIAGWYADDTPRDHPLISPLFADLTGMPPCLIHVGSIEVLLSDSERMAKKLTEAGGRAELKIWPDMPHVWQFMAPWLKQATRSLRQISDFLNSHW